MKKVLSGVLGVFGLLILILMLVPLPERPVQERAAPIAEKPATPAPKPAAPSPPASWQTTQTWTGSGMKETESFRVSGREWRIAWESSKEPFPNAGILQIFVHRSDGSLVTLAANQQGVGKDTSYVRSAGEHYLKITAANVQWTVRVEERR